MKDQTINEYSKMIKFCELTLREHWGNGADPVKIIGISKEIGLHDLADEFNQMLKDEKETERENAATFEPSLKTLGNH